MIDVGIQALLLGGAGLSGDRHLKVSDRLHNHGVNVGRLFTPG